MTNTIKDVVKSINSSDFPERVAADYAAEVALENTEQYPAERCSVDVVEMNISVHLDMLIENGARFQYGEAQDAAVEKFFNQLSVEDILAKGVFVGAHNGRNYYCFYGAWASCMEGGLYPNFEDPEEMATIFKKRGQ